MDARNRCGHDDRGSASLVDPGSLPAALKAALDRLGHGRARSEFAPRAAEISATYRGGGSSSGIRSADDALAYALTRMPATYAAVTASLIELARLRPDFAPASLLDAGAGPGTASWAATEVFVSLDTITQLDANPALRALARDLVQDAPRLSNFGQSAGNLRTALGDAQDADLVIASYVMGEIAEADRTAVAELMWRRTKDTLLVVEPGTPAGHARLMEIRTRLIAAGAHVVAPCPHALACPLTAPDWCHFTQRLARSRDHKRVKGAELPYEDEKFSYLGLARAPSPQATARVLAQPLTTKIEVTAKLCLADGHAAITKTPKRDKARYADARRWRWGDAVDGGS